MQDVKILLQKMFVAWWILLAGFLAGGLISWRLKVSRRYWRALSTGGWLTIGLIFAILIFVVISFNSLFTDFHRIFFSGDSWLFQFSDTFIRLFPIQFWQDGFIWVGVFAIVFAFLIGFFGNKFAKHN